MNILKSFLLIWTYPVSKGEKNNNDLSSSFGKSKLGTSEFFNGLEVFSKSRKYSFK